VWEALRKKRKMTSTTSADVTASSVIPSFFEIKESGVVRNLSEKNRIGFF
jgi:hypothetical protein